MELGNKMVEACGGLTGIGPFKYGSKRGICSLHISDGSFGESGVVIVKSVQVRC